MSDSRPASSPCFAHELVAGQPVDPDTARDLARFRKAERARLIDARLAIPADDRAALADEIGDFLDTLIDLKAAPIVSLYWPFKGELDFRPWMARARASGARIALPIVKAMAEPLTFREWTPGCEMTRGVWNIPIPAEGQEITPNVVVSPVVGVDPNCYRLGYGGGFYDRTLAAIGPDRQVIGVGHPVAEIPTIFPQHYDIPMDVVVLGADHIRRREMP